MRIYLAARWSRREELKGYALQLADAGHEVVSRWLYDERRLEIGAPVEQGRPFARGDLFDLHRTECLIAFTEEPGKAGGRNRGGRHVEFGIALGRRPHIRLMVVGHRENVFHYLAQVEFFEAWPAALQALTATQVAPAPWPGVLP